MLVCLCGNVDVCLWVCGGMFTCVDVNVCVVCVNVCLRVRGNVDVCVGSVNVCLRVCEDVDMHGGCTDA